MGIDLVLLQDDKGGDLASVKLSEARRGSDPTLVDSVFAMYKEWTKGELTTASHALPLIIRAAVSFEKAQLQKQINVIQKAIGLKMRASHSHSVVIITPAHQYDIQAKEDAEELKAEKVLLDAQVASIAVTEKAAETAMRKKAGTIGNIVHASVPVSNNEVSPALLRNINENLILAVMQDDNVVERTYHPDGPNVSPTKGVDILSHDEVMFRLDILEMERGPFCLSFLSIELTTTVIVGAKVAGHRGFFLTGDGVDLNQAMINYGLDFLRDRGFKKMQPPFFMNKSLMGKTAQLEEFDEALYKVRLRISLRIMLIRFNRSREMERITRSTSSRPPSNRSPHSTPTNGSSSRLSNFRANTLDTRLVSARRPVRAVGMYSVSSVSINSRRWSRYVASLARNRPADFWDSL